jgi:perosamine synthetase
VFSPETGITRERLQAAFAAANIDARVFFWPLSSLPMFKAVHSTRLAWDIPGRAINLPSYHDMLAEDLYRVVMCVSDELMRGIQ